MNPTDAYRKQARKREIKRNKAERTFIRDAFGKRTQAAELKSELEELIAQEETAEGLSKLQKLRKKVVLEAYEAAIRKQKVRAGGCCCMRSSNGAAYVLSGCPCRRG